jgi:adenine deaminase
MVTTDQLLQQLTRNPSLLWGLQDRGVIAENKIADLVFVKNDGTLFSNDPGKILLVIQEGKPLVYSGKMAEQFKGHKGFSTVSIDSQPLHVRGDLPGLTKEILHYYPAAGIPFHIDE